MRTDDSWRFQLETQQEGRDMGRTIKKCFCVACGLWRDYGSTDVDGKRLCVRCTATVNGTMAPE